MKRVVMFTLFGTLAAASAWAADYPTYPPEDSTAVTPETGNRVLVVPDTQQQAQMPYEPETRTPNQLETLRSDSMSAPNVTGETVPEDPATGVPRPGADPRRLESVPKP